MREVEVCLYFLQPCLSGVKNKTRNDADEPHYVFLRDRSGERALIFQEHWNRTMVFARKAMSRSVKPVYDVRFDPAVTGDVGLHHRYYDARNPNLYKKHEAFLEGTQITVCAMLPDRLRPQEFRETLEMAGRFAGITLYGWGEYGRFEVVSAA